MHFRLRTLLLRAVGADVPLRCRVFPGVTIRTPLLTLGDRSTINTGTIIDNRAPVTIGSRVGVAIGVRLITSNHDMTDPECRAGAGHVEPIVIEDGAWVGSGATILSGVTIGRGAVVAAGAVVREDCEPHGLYGGVPARLIRSLEPLDLRPR